MLDARFSHLYFCQSLHTQQRGRSAIAELLIKVLCKKIIRAGLVQVMILMRPDNWVHLPQLQKIKSLSLENLVICPKRTFNNNSLEAARNSTIAVCKISSVINDRG